MVGDKPVLTPGLVIHVVGIDGHGVEREDGIGGGQPLGKVGKGLVVERTAALGPVKGADSDR